MPAVLHAAKSVQLTTRHYRRDLVQTHNYYSHMDSNTHRSTAYTLLTAEKRLVHIVKVLGPWTGCESSRSNFEVYSTILLDTAAACFLVLVFACIWLGFEHHLMCPRQSAGGCHSMTWAC